MNRRSYSFLCISLHGVTSTNRLCVDGMQRISAPSVLVSGLCACKHLKYILFVYSSKCLTTLSVHANFVLFMIHNIVQVSDAKLYDAMDTGTPNTVQQ